MTNISKRNTKCGKMYIMTILKCAGGCTSNLANHLQAKHKIDINKNEETSPT